VGHKKQDVEESLKQSFGSLLNFAWQREQNGTGDALKSYFSENPKNEKFDYTFVVCADTPLITEETFQRLWIEIQNNTNLLAVAATFETENPRGYGRIVKAHKGFKIIEEKDASDEERRINEVNSGFYLIKTDYLLKKLSQIHNKNKSGEFYLTDVFSQDSDVLALKFEDETEFLGVNTLEQLEAITKVLRYRKLQQLMIGGVMCFDASSTWVDQDVQIEAGVILHPGVKLFGQTKIQKNVLVESGAILKDCIVEEGVQILAYCHLEKAIIRKNAHIGPFARLRPESDIGEGSKIGNFVEIKKSLLHAGVKVSHLSYVGDAEIGEESNIGCGFITCNYDGRDKHKTKIGKHVFIGSDVQAVAPINIGDHSFVAAGSTITKDVPSEGFAIARSAQSTKEGMAHRFLKSKKSK
ncbi:MAG: bifunctional UDP-N-acetylglucosamine diphosphorylase/glucosamine-1-phosphate N-acetyltransferase GlmU, partial [Bacteriovoracaceae bacterium]|nr:bifunctional UDP-N-acetylglucosamine diphosphorylase/glucosamine-1-phosphate N-acetyltransferase GlmU [Bacteriovoracaceae bacterium]